MSDIYVTFICPAADAPVARAAAQAAAGEAAAGMLELGLSPTGSAPATHYVSSGWVRPSIHAALAPHCLVIADGADPHAAFAAAGLVIITDPA